MDLCNEAWEVVEITIGGWRVLPSSPVRFHRSKGMLPLPVPVNGGSLDELRPFVNTGSEEDWMLMVAWLLAAIRPTGPYPVLLLEGEQGSAKSTTGRVLRALVDPNVAALRTVPRDERDLMIAARNGWVVGYDNLSGIPICLSDAICRLSTGGGFSTRELYTDTEETLIDVQRPAIINGIDALADRGDLQDRAIPLVLPQINPDRRRDEKVFWGEFETIRPRILGSLLDVVRVALGRVNGVRLAELPRMADFALWITAAEIALGWKEGSFLAAYTKSRQAANETLVDQDPVAKAVRDLAEADNNRWTGTASALLDKLSDREGEAKTKAKSWPKSPQGLSNRLRRVAPSLRAGGIEINFRREDTTERRRLIEIGMGRQNIVQSVQRIPETHTGSRSSGRTVSMEGPSKDRPESSNGPSKRALDDPMDDLAERSSNSKGTPQAVLDDLDGLDDILPTHSRDGNEWEEIS